jgi:hypothetical protein
VIGVGAHEVEIHFDTAAEEGIRWSLDLCLGAVEVLERLIKMTRGDVVQRPRAQKVHAPRPEHRLERAIG